jgi:iron uptake system EfeUOB component EfeO/EfeM
MTTETTTEFFQRLERLLDQYEIAIENILYRELSEADIRETLAEINAIRGEMSRITTLP